MSRRPDSPSGKVTEGSTNHETACSGKCVTKDTGIRRTALSVLIFIFWVLVAFSYAESAFADCPAAMSGYWKLDETSPGSYVDDIGGHPGVCIDGSCPERLTGAIGVGQSFDGISDKIIVEANPALDWSSTQSFTIELWVRRDNAPIQDGLEVFIGRTATDNDLAWYIGINSAGNAQAQLRAAGGQAGAVLTVNKSLNRIELGTTWHHVVLVRDAGSASTTLYVDGVSASQTVPYASGFASETAPMTLGAFGATNYFHGDLDEVAIYERALDNQEICSHYYIARGYCDFYSSRVKIMPLGDSITKGDWTGSLLLDDERIGYRLDLWNLLNANLYWADFVGSEQNGIGIDPAFDDDHAGFGGISDAQLLYLLETGYNLVSNQYVTSGPYLETHQDHPTEVILLHIGTNDLNVSPDDVEDILNQIDSFSKNVTVVLSRIINQSFQSEYYPGHSSIVDDFNDNIESVALARKAQGDKIIVVDMEDGTQWNYNEDRYFPYDVGDMYDGKHPNPTGYGKMAGVWFEALEIFLPQSQVPLFTSTAPMIAVRNVQYTYDSNADGPPSPRYELVAGPDGMIVDPLSGFVQWTPDTVGEYSVTLRAFNWAGEHEQSFTITVNATDNASNGGGGGGGGGCFISTIF